MNQIRRYIEHAPEAISGNGGHSQTLKVARCLFNGFGLSRQEMLEWLGVYNARLSEKWTARELEHKADAAANGSYDKPAGWMLQDAPHTCKPVAIKCATMSHVVPATGKKYVLATVATVNSYSYTDTGAHTRTHNKELKSGVASVATRPPLLHQEWETTVATVADEVGPRGYPHRWRT